MDPCETPCLTVLQFGFYSPADSLLLVLKPPKMRARYAVNFYFFLQNIVVDSVQGFR